MWRTVSLKNTRIYDWAGFVRFFNQTQSSRLDLRKMMLVKDRDQTWQDMLDVSERFQALRSVELPRVPGPVLTGLVGYPPTHRKRGLHICPHVCASLWWHTRQLPM